MAVSFLGEEERVWKVEGCFTAWYGTVGLH
jgi:hypothetical protein